MRLHFSFGCDFVKVSISASFRSFLLNFCIDTAESTTNSRSSGLRYDVGKHLFSEGEKDATLFFSFKFRTLLASFHAACPSLLPLCLLLRPILKFWSVWVTLMRFTWANQSERRILVLNVSVMYNGFLCISHIGLGSACLSSSVKSMKTSAAPYPGIRNPIVVYLTSNRKNGFLRLKILLILLQRSHCTSGTILFKPFVRVNLVMRLKALFPKSETTLGFVEKAILEDATFHRMN